MTNAAAEPQAAAQAQQVTVEAKVSGLAEAAAGGRGGGRRKRGCAARAAEEEEATGVAAAADGTGQDLVASGRPTRRAKQAAASAIAVTAAKEAAGRRARGGAGAAATAALAAAAGPVKREEVNEDAGDEAQEQEQEQEERPKPTAKPRARAASRKKVKKDDEPGSDADADAGPAAATPAKSPTAAKRGRAAAGTAGAGSKSPGKAAAAVRLLDDEAAAALAATPLLDLGQLVPGKLIRRPSATVKTPYVADVQLLLQPPGDGAAAHEPDSGGGGSGELVLAHAPAMDCAGMVTPGSAVFMSRSAPRAPGAPPAATSHAIQLVEDQRPGGGAAVVGYHPQLAERLAAELVRRRLIEGALGAGRVVGLESQRTFGNTRVDYVLRMEDGSRVLLEVKNVVCADFPDVEGGVPPGRPAVGVYRVPVPSGRLDDYTPTALFPHGAQKPKIKVVSDRAIKHVTELTQLHRHGRELPPEGSAAGAEGPQAEEPGEGGSKGEGEGRLRCAVLFLVNRSDCSAFRPCHEADPLFAQVLKAAEEAGVKLIAYNVEWRGGAAFAGRQLPVVFGPGVTSAYDPARLAEVLHFNATDPRKNWKSAKAKEAKAAAIAKAVKGGKAKAAARRGGKRARKDESSSDGEGDSE